MFATRSPGRAVIALAVTLIVAVFGVPDARADSSPPRARIRIMSASGMAPFTVHVHALASDVGDPMQARYEWNFDNAGSPYNRLDGWNAAHIYRQPGTYDIRLKVTDSKGRTAVATRRVQVSPDVRRRVHVSPQGNDANDGSWGWPVRTAARARQLTQDNTMVLFERGGQYNLNSPFHIEASNVVLGAYGGGADPVFMWTGNIPYAGIITMWWWARDIVIQNIKFDSYSSVLDNTIVRGTHPHGNNITVTECDFGRVSYAMNTEFGCNGFLAQDNHAGTIGAYFIWAIGRDHTYLGNTVLNDADEHTIRLANATRVNVAYNDLTNTQKATVWAMLGRWCHIAHNTLRSGRVLIGPNFADGSDSERFRNCVADGNLILDEGFVLYSGAEDVMLRNNIIRANGRDAISIWGWYAPQNRTTRDVRVYHNTVINNHTQNGCFLRLGDGAQDIKVVNNLYVAPWLNTHNNSANVYSNDNTLESHLFRNNVWSVPATSPFVHFMSGGQGLVESQWNSYSQVGQEWYYDFFGAELNSAYRPQFNAEHGRALAGVQTDFYGEKRPRNGHRTVGAVEN
jgi:PKD repeat protein